MAIAITGLACRLPGDGNNLNSFWDSICNGTSAWSQIPRDRFDPAAFPAAIPQGAHFLTEDISLFDANFFRISHNEARAMDPQQRLMLEVVYEALEAGGYPLEALAGTSTGVYMGQFTSDYKELICRDPEAALPFSVAGLQPTSLANRISWLFDLKGPSLTMDTACSSSLVALHLACQSIRAGESHMAIVGGCNLMISPDMFIFEAGQGFLSPDGKCKTFDQSANGYGRGEGFATVVLKRLDLAIRDGDPIRAVIRGTASNQDGHTKGFTLPSSEAQASLIRSVYRSAGLEFDQTSYVEAHGTGTKAGDLEETTALAKTIAAVRPDGKKLMVGSVKSNIGHLEAAAGLAGLMKSVKMLETGKIPPNISLHNPNPNIKFDEWNLRVPTAMTPWPTDGLRRISINSFGYGGSNAHIVLDDAHSYLSQNGLHGVHATKATGPNDASKAVWEEPSSSRYRVFPISAQDKDGIGRVKKVLASFLTEKSAQLQTVQENDYLDDLAFTLSERRSHLQWKTFFIASSLDQLVDTLGSEETTTPAHLSSRKPRLGFVFTGQGAQWANMGMELMQYRVFRDSIEAADRYLRQQLDCKWSAAEELARGKSTSNLRRALYSQALCTVLQVALVDLLREWGIVPEAVVGHSSGEIAAAYCLGALSREHAWQIAYFRGVMSSKLKDSGLEGSMMAVGASPEEVAETLSQLAPDRVHIACINSPKSVTLSGDTDAIDLVLQALQEKGVFARKLQVDTAYHSPHMHLVAREYLEAILDISTTSPRGECRMYSSVTGEVIESEELGAVYWVRNLMSPVRFAPAMQQLASKEKALDILVEVGPHSALQGPSTQSLQGIGITDIPYHSVLVRHQSGIETALNLVGTLSAQGYPVCLREVNHSRRTPRPLVDLPAYPWNHSQSHWAESRVAREYRLRASPYNSLLGAPAPSLVGGERVWRRRIRLSEQPWIADHKIQGSVFYPAAGFIASAIEAALSTAEVGHKVAKFRLRDVNLKAALPLDEDEDVEYSVGLRPHLAATQDAASPWTEFTISSCRDGKTLERNCLGLIMLEYESPNIIKTEESLMLRYREASEHCRTAVKPGSFYQSLSSIGFHYGPAFQNVTEIRTGVGQSCGVVDIPDVGLGTPQRPHIIHPATLDAVFHLVFAALGGGPDGVTQAMVPTAIDEVVISADIAYEAGLKLTGFSDASRRGFKDMLADIIMNDEAKNLPVLEVSGLVCTEIGGGSSGNADPCSARSVFSSLVWRPAINLLQLEEQEAVITQAVGVRREVNLAWDDSVVSIAAAASELIKLVHHCNPRMSVSEVVIDTSTTQSILCYSGGLADVVKTANCKIWCPDESTRQKAQEACQGLENVQTELRDLTKPLPNDEAPLQASDLIIIPLALSDSEYIEQIIRSAKQLLASDGRLCLTVPTRQSEDVEALGKKIGLSNWIKINDFEDPDNQQLTLLVGSNSSNPTHAQNRTHGRDEVIILKSPVTSQAATHLSEQLRECLTSLGYAASFQSWEDSASSWTGKSCISLLELDHPMLEDPTEADFDRIKSLILETDKTLWVSGQSEPYSAIVAGLARVVRNEEPGLAFHTLQFDFSQCLCADRLAKLILRAFDNGSRDKEYMIENEVIHVSRVLEDDGMNGKLHFLSPENNKTMSEVALGESAGPLKLCIRNAGLLDSLCFELDPVAGTILEEDEVEITVKATSVSIRDFMTVMGQLPGTDLGFDAAGIVRRVGSAVTRFNIGDRVVMCNPGSHRTVLRAKADLCELIPEGMPFEEAATIPLDHGTAWYALMRLGRAQKGQTMLIHAAAGGVGQAAMQIARHVGMDIFATVGSDAEKMLLRDTYGVADDHIFNSRDLSFVDGVRRMTNGRGVDVVLNSLSGEASRHTWYCVAPFGTFIEMGVKDKLGNSRLDMRPFLQDASFTSFDLQRIAKQRPDILADVMRGAFELLRNGVTKPIAPLAVFPASEVESAFQFAERGQHLGKAVLTFSDKQVVPCLQRHELSLDLDPEATYLLAGGLGGLGRGIAKMLVDNGARRLCFLSRSGAKSPAAQELVRDLEDCGVRVLVQACDIADPGAVRDAVQLCSKKLGRVRGVLQCAMVLRDTLFRNMTHNEWVESTRPKVQGTWNLHQSLPEVDFFVTLGSFTTIFGNRGQSNYAAGGAYQDAVAHFRRTQGLHAVTIDVGVVRDAGVLAEQGMSNTLQEFEGPCGLDEDELLNIIKLAVAGDVAGTITPQLLTGLATGGSAMAAGVDPAWYLDDAKFSIMAQTRTGEATGKVAQQDASVQPRLSEATCQAEASSIVMEALVNRVTNMLQTDPSEIDTNRFLHSYGIDSLVAIQVVDWALKECKSQITVLDVMAGVPITETAKKIAAKSLLLRKDLE